MKYYAQLQVDIVVGWVHSTTIIQQDNYVEITNEQCNDDIMYRKYDRLTKTFSEEKFKPMDSREDFLSRVTDLENANAQLMLKVAILEGGAANV